MARCESRRPPSFDGMLANASISLFKGVAHSLERLVCRGLGLSKGVRKLKLLHLLDQFSKTFIDHTTLKGVQAYIGLTTLDVEFVS